MATVTGKLFPMLNRNLVFTNAHNVRTIRMTSMLKEVYSVQDVDDFEKRVVQSNKPTVVQFHASWCKPCKLLSPRLEKAIIANGKADMAKVDIDKVPDLTDRFNICAVPTVIGFNGGQKIGRIEGNVDDDKIGSLIEKVVAGK